MKVGLRTPSLKRSIKARTTGKLKRQVKSAVNPLYGKKEWDSLRIPKNQSKMQFITGQPLELEI